MSNRRQFLKAIPVAAAGAASLVRETGRPRAQQTAAKFVITYTGNPPAEVRNAVQAGLDRWAAVLTSPVDITVAFNWVASGPAATYGVTRFKNFSGAPRTEVGYPAALANRLARGRVSGDGPDIRMNVNAAASITGVPDVFSWYLGTDGRPSPVQFDLMTTVMILAGYGMGFGGTLRTAGSRGIYGSTAGTPYVFDLLFTDAAGKRLLEYPNDSTELGTALLEQARLDGPRIRQAAGGALPFSLYTYSYDPIARPVCTAPAVFSAFMGIPGLGVPAPSALDVAVLNDLGWASPATQLASPPAGAVVVDAVEKSIAPPVGCVAEAVEVPVSVQPGLRTATREATTANITLNFAPGFPDIARPALQEAARTWSQLIASPVEIIITASWDLDLPGALGRCLSREVKDFPNAPLAGVRYPTSLANRFAGSRVASGDDMNVQFNDDAPWYFGTDGKPSIYEYELLGVALHEIGHGLGHLGTPLALSPGEPLRVWDVFFADRWNGPMSAYPLDSAELAVQVSDGAYFRGPATLGATQGKGVRLHPSGHRYSEVFCSGAEQPLMATPAFPGRVSRPNDLLIAMLRDIGWGAPTATPVFRRGVLPVVGRD